jgi:hypothetical protein
MKQQPVYEPVQLHGFLLEFTEKQYGEIKEMLIECGYEPDSEGLKKMILDGLTEEDGYAKGKNLGNMVGNFIAENPQVLGNGLKLAGGLISRLTKAKRGR